MNQIFKKALPHLTVLVLFVIIALVYFNPVLQGKQIFQSDIVQYTGMAKERNDYRANEGKESYWTNSAFGGMPTYQLGAQYEHHYIKKLDNVLRFLPRPADYLFIYFLGFYVLMYVLKKDHKLAFLGAIAFGFSTYLIIIIGVGHNAKAHAIAYMPLVLAGLFLVFQKKYIAGFFLACIAMALELVANHYQMTYYMLLLILVIGIVYLLDAYKNKEIPHFLKSVGVLAAAFILAVLLNATNILATQEYAKESTRGNSELTITADGGPKKDKGLSKEYITEYSYGVLESFNLLVSRFMGDSEYVNNSSNTYTFLTNQGLNNSETKNFIYRNYLITYWGNQPIVAAPAYIGAVVFFLAFIGIFLTKGRHKRWVIAGSIMALLLSWGKNFEILTNLFIDYFPLYNKFRAVSSIQVILELCLPILAVFGLYHIFSEKKTFEEKKKALLYSGGILGGLCLIFVLFGKSLFSFAGANDGYYIQAYGMDFINALKDDRKSLLVKDSFRSLVFILLSAAIVFYFIKQKLSKNVAVGLFAILILADLTVVNKRYVNDENFVNASQVSNPFPQFQVDTEIQKDQSHYRVYDMTANAFSSGRASFYHKALGGYHAAKPQRIQDLYDFYLEKGLMEIFNMLNVKYIILNDENNVIASQNDAANGNAWFVNEIKTVASADEELMELGKINTKTTAVVHQEFEGLIKEKIFSVDSLASVKLIDVKPDYLYYETENTQPGTIVFSEIYYPHGWNAYLNGKEVPHFRADYTLRAIHVPEGYNKIEFKFEPEVVKKGNNIALAGSILFILLALGAVYYTSRKPKE